MKIPPRLLPLVEDGIVEEVLAQVRSGKEADVFVVRVGGEARCAKVYKEADNRSFRQAAIYREGRKAQNSRSARAMSKRTRYGQREAESSWINAEVEALNALSAAGLRVPRPFGFYDGVLIMELIMGEDGQPAPRLDDIELSAETAFLYHEEMISQIVLMLCAGIIHGDLSEFNVLVDRDGPVIIDLPQAVNAAGNNSAEMLFKRDVDNMARYFGRFAPEILGLKYAKEIWALYAKGKLTPQVELTGHFREPERPADVGGVLAAIGDARKEHESRRPGRSDDRGAGKPRQEPEGRPHTGHGEPARWGNPRNQGQQGQPNQQKRGGKPSGHENRAPQPPSPRPQAAQRPPVSPKPPTSPKQQENSQPPNPWGRRPSSGRHNGPKSDGTR